MSGIYIHIPFCRQACSYCDFYFVTRQDLIPRFIESLCNEIIHSDFSAKDMIKTVYFGGGTPSRLNISQLTNIIQSLNEKFDLSNLREVTFEVNPDDITASYLGDLKKAGITRLSIGIQSFNPEILHFMHRAHTSEHAHSCLRMINEADFQSFTVDLIYGNPNQSVADLEKDLICLMKYSPPHVSAYALTVEPATRLGKALKLGKLQPADDSEVATHMDMITDHLHSAGIDRYEVSNFARYGHEALHNSSYWNHVPYIGFGPASHSFDGTSRWKNESDVNKYIQNNGLGLKTEFESLSQIQLAEEFLMMQMRTKAGVDIKLLESKYSYKLSENQLSYIKLMYRKELLRVNQNESDFKKSIRLTAEGMKIADLIVLEILSRFE